VSVRARLTLLFVTAMASLIVATSLASYLIVRSRLQSQASSSAGALARAAALAEADESSLDKLAGPGDQIWLTARDGHVVATSYRASGTSRLTLARVLSRPPPGSTVAQAARPEGGRAIVVVANHDLHETLSTLGRTLAIVGLAVLVVSGVAGSFLAVRALRPVERLREQVDAIPGDALDRRVAEGRGDELGRLARAFNRLLTRAAQAAEQQQRFVADASHELKTPVTALQGHARIVSRAAERGDLEQARDSARIVEQQTARLAATLGELLTLAESGARGRRNDPVRLDRVASDVCAELRLAHPDRTLELELVPVTVAGDPGRLHELVRVLVDNAIKYSPPASGVTIGVTDGSTPQLTVRDHGPGMTLVDRQRAFDRFFRGANAAGVPGSGLGLAIAQAISERHGATLALDDASGGGTLASVSFGSAPATD
jgi:two-component system, OmpR family, sensor histidine kinase MprB